MIERCQRNYIRLLEERILFKERLKKTISRLMLSILRTRVLNRWREEQLKIWCPVRAISQNTCSSWSLSSITTRDTRKWRTFWARQSLWFWKSTKLMGSHNWRRINKESKRSRCLRKYLSGIWRNLWAEVFSMLEFKRLCQQSYFKFHNCVPRPRFPSKIKELLPKLILNLQMSRKRNSSTGHNSTTVLPKHWKSSWVLDSTKVIPTTLFATG